MSQEKKVRTKRKPNTLEVFFPWAIFCWIYPIISVLFVNTGISIKRLNPEEMAEANIKASVV